MAPTGKQIYTLHPRIPSQEGPADQVVTTAVDSNLTKVECLNTKGTSLMEFSEDCVIEPPDIGSHKPCVIKPLSDSSGNGSPFPVLHNTGSHTHQIPDNTGPMRGVSSPVEAPDFAKFGRRHFKTCSRFLILTLFALTLLCSINGAPLNCAQTANALVLTESVRNAAEKGSFKSRKYAFVLHGH